MALAWPFNEEYAPMAWHVAARDDEVTPELWNHSCPNMRAWRDPTLGKLHLVAQYASGGLGHSSFPRSVYSYFGLFTTQTGYNGGGQYPERKYLPGQQIYKTRKPLPVETVRIASLPEDYATAVQAVNNDPNFLFDCVNQGWPMRMANALDEQVKVTLRKLLHNTKGQPQANDRERHLVLGAGPSNSYLKLILLDTGAMISVMNVGAECMMETPKPTNMTITSANMRQTACKLEGTVTLRVINTPRHPGFKEQTEVSFRAVTMAPLARELLSITDLYKQQGYSLILDRDNGVGELRRGNTTDQDNSRIPLRYDQETSQFFLDYMPYTKDNQEEDQRGTLLAMSAMHGIYDAAIVPRTYTETQVTQLLKELKEDQKGALKEIMDYTGKPDVEVIHAQHEDDRMIRGALETIIDQWPQKDDRYGTTPIVWTHRRRTRGGQL